MAHSPHSFPGAHHFSITGPVFNNAVSTYEALASIVQSAPHAPAAPTSAGTGTGLAQNNFATGNESDSAVYARFLMTRKRGYPLWRPKDHDPRLPDIYKQDGVHIGDVGILDEFGGFDYLFNACHPADHPINEGRVPENFKLLQIDHTDTKESPQEFEPGSYVESKPSCISKTMISGPTPPGVPEEIGAGLSFSSSAPNGALLILPEGGKRTDHQQLSKFYEYAVECAQSWYAHVNEPMARGVHNGALYLVTGFDKARAWGAASFVEANPGSVSLEFIPKTQINVGRPPRYWFRRHNCASALSDADIVYGNQSGCVFLRGFKIAVRHNPFTKIPKLSSSVKYISDLDADEVFPKPRAANFPTWNSILRQPYHASGLLSNEYSVLENHIYHPSDVINGWVLRNYDEVQVSITHDDDWAFIIRDDEEMPANEELTLRISEHVKLVKSSGFTHAHFDLHTRPNATASYDGGRKTESSIGGSFDLKADSSLPAVSAPTLTKSVNVAAPEVVRSDVALHHGPSKDKVRDDTVPDSYLPTKESRALSSILLHAASELRPKKTRPRGPQAKAKGGCWTCRFRRKKCDERADAEGRCKACVRLKLQCIGFGGKLPERLKEHGNVTELRDKIKYFLASEPYKTAPEDPPSQLSCFFCRARKIACGPNPNSKDRTCNQCSARSLKCEYPTEIRRGIKSTSENPSSQLLIPSEELDQHISVSNAHDSEQKWRTFW